MTRRHVEYIFPTPLFISKIEDSSLLDDTITSLNRLTVDDIASEDALCKTTLDDLNLRYQFQDIKKVIDSEVRRVYDDLGVIRSKEIITCMWANMSKAANRHALHPHGNSYMSGVLYLSTPKDCGNIGFKDPRQGNEIIVPDYTEDSIFKNRTIEVEPKKGLLLMFPSWLYHWTKPHVDNFDRWNISFNVLPTGKINHNMATDSTAHIKIINDTDQ